LLDYSFQFPTSVKIIFKKTPGVARVIAENKVPFLFSGHDVYLYRCQRYTEKLPAFFLETM